MQASNYTQTNLTVPVFLFVHSVGVSTLLQYKLHTLFELRAVWKGHKMLD